MPQSFYESDAFKLKKDDETVNLTIQKAFSSASSIQKLGQSGFMSFADLSVRQSAKNETSDFKPQEAFKRAIKQLNVSISEEKLRATIVKKQESRNTEESAKLRKV